MILKGPSESATRNHPFHGEVVSPDAEAMSLPFITLDLTPRFLTFYAAARHEPNPEQRWVSWQTRYAFAAVPPTPAGQAMARQLLDAAWPHYEAALPLIQRGAADLFADAEAELRRVQTLLETPNLLPTRVIGYVGAFENNASVARQGEVLNVCLPVETARETRLPLLAHELTHVVHCAAGGSDGEWTRSLASSLLAEGLAMRVTQQLFPDAPLAQVVGEAAWLAACAAKESALLSAM